MRVQALIITAAVILLAGCAHKEATPAQDKRIVRVEAMCVNPENGSLSREYSGTIEAGTETPLSFTIPGTVKSVSVQVGQKVTRGQVIATLDDVSLRNTLAIALADQEQAMDAERRMKILHDAKALAEIKWVDIQAKVKQAKAAVEIAQRALKDAVLHAPTSGTVAQKMVEPGQTAVPGVPVVTLLSGKEPRAVASIPENEIGQFQEGQNAIITSDALKGTEIQGRLVEKGVQADPVTRNYTVKWALSSSADLSKLLPGMICTIKVNNDANGAPESALVLPIEAVVLNDDNSKSVWVIEHSLAQPRKVVVGDLGDRGVQIISGLMPGDSVITQGWQEVGAGTRVQVVK